MGRFEAGCGTPIFIRAAFSEAEMLTFAIGILCGILIGATGVLLVVFFNAASVNHVTLAEKQELLKWNRTNQW